MKYEIYYLNSVGTKIDLCAWPYMIETGDFLGYEWDFTSVNNYNSYGGKISGFTRPITSRNVELTVMANSAAAYREALDTLIDAFERDVRNLAPGKLYVNGNYLKCYITAGEPSDWEDPSNSMNIELTITSEYPMWIIERDWVFAQTGALSAGNKAYPYRYAYRYPNGHTTGKITQPLISPANFKLTIHGPVSSPQVQIGEFIYGLNTTISDKDYAVIDSAAGTITLYKNGQAAENIFNSRTRENSVFERLKPGTLDVKWTGEFRFVITVCEERSMPKWRS
ncbi:MAG: hypothetical protein IKC09_08920 [Oscillospiraceae bacterium]|nr:hypothetical protein [Oscillospiraceae bacterium]